MLTDATRQPMAA